MWVVPRPPPIQIAKMIVETACVRLFCCRKCRATNNARVALLCLQHGLTPPIARRCIAVCEASHDALRPSPVPQQPQPHRASTGRPSIALHADTHEAAGLMPRVQCWGNVRRRAVVNNEHQVRADTLLRQRGQSLPQLLHILGRAGERREHHRDTPGPPGAMQTLRCFREALRVHFERACHDSCGISPLCQQQLEAAAFCKSCTATVAPDGPNYLQEHEHQRPVQRLGNRLPMPGIGPEPRSAERLLPRGGARDVVLT
mmetsp:Transcript_32742/g.76131  ORF Transcript_32742/g.76131 Transcript_32742/m.76131 type:complete len:258 (-) Transcript_32742:223-996(-)